MASSCIWGPLGWTRLGIGILFHGSSPEQGAELLAGAIMEHHVVGGQDDVVLCKGLGLLVPVSRPTGVRQHLQVGLQGAVTLSGPAARSITLTWQEHAMSSGRTEGKNGFLQLWGSPM